MNHSGHLNRNQVDESSSSILYVQPKSSSEASDAHVSISVNKIPTMAIRDRLMSFNFIQSALVCITEGRSKNMFDQKPLFHYIRRKSFGEGSLASVCTLGLITDRSESPKPSQPAKNVIVNVPSSLTENKSPSPTPSPSPEKTEKTEQTRPRHSLSRLLSNEMNYNGKIDLSMIKPLKRAETSIKPILISRKSTFTTLSKKKTNSSTQDKKVRFSTKRVVLQYYK